MISSAWFLLDNALAITIGWAAARRAYGPAPTPARVLATVAGYPVVVVTSLFLLGTLGALHCIWVTAILAAAAGLSLRARPRTPDGPADEQAASNEGALWLVTLALALGATTLVLAQPHLTGFWYSGDDLTYHGPATVTWLRGGPFHLPTENFHAYYPFNAELVALGFTLLLLIALPLERANARLMSRAYPNQPNVGAAWRAIDRLPAGSQVAAFGDYAHHSYPLNGRRFQLRGRSVDATGRAVAALHETWRHPVRPDPRASESLTANLRDSGIDFVLVTRRADGGWPPQRVALESAARVSTVYTDEGSRIYALGSER